MFEAIKRFFQKEKVDYGQLVKDGAIILDVRTPAEYKGGHIKGSKNIPLAEFGHKVKQYTDKDKVYITCCASGMRSASARSIMKSSGYTNVYNGGGWSGLQSKL
jgi:phage shock protein E